MQIRKTLIPILFLVLLALAGCEFGGSGAGSQTTDATPQDLTVDDIVSATGEVRPVRWAALSFPVSGAMRAIHVEEGQEVTAGKPLIELDAVQLERAVTEAQAALSSAEADLARVEAGPNAQDVAAAQEALAAAQANAKVAETQVTAAEARQRQAQAGVSIAQAQVSIAQAGVKVAEAELSRAQAGASQQDLAIAGANLDKARAAVQLAQAEYDRTNKASDTSQALALQQATLDLEAAQAETQRLAAGPRPSDLAPLTANVETAEAQVLLAEAQVEQARSQVVQAEADVAQAQAALEAARAQAGQAQAALDRLQAGATPEEVAVAQATVDRAREALVTAQALLDQATLIAPFDGTVGQVDVRQDEEVMPGQVVLLLGDLTLLRVETTDLDEIDVARVQVGQRVDLTFDALPEKVLAGRVARVAPVSTPNQAATTYTVLIDFEETDPALRWGMTAFADIRVE
jgi:HlyD family secretion protein